MSWFSFPRRMPTPPSPFYSPNESGFMFSPGAAATLRSRGGPPHEPAQHRGRPPRPLHRPGRRSTPQRSARVAFPKSSRYLLANFFRKPREEIRRVECHTPRPYRPVVAQASRNSLPQRLPGPRPPGLLPEDRSDGGAPRATLAPDPPQSMRHEGGPRLKEQPWASD